MTAKAAQHGQCTALVHVVAQHRCVMGLLSFRAIVFVRVAPRGHGIVTNPLHFVVRDGHTSRVPRHEDAVAVEASQQIVLHEDILGTLDEDGSTPVQSPI